MVVSSVLAFAGIALARRYYLVDPGRRAGLDERFRFAVGLLRNRWYIDALYEEKLVEGIILRLSKASTRLDERIIDAAVGSSAGFCAFYRGFCDGLTLGLSMGWCALHQ